MNFFSIMIEYIYEEEVQGLRLSSMFFGDKSESCLQVLFLLVNLLPLDDLLDVDGRLDSDHDGVVTVVPGISNILGHGGGVGRKVEVGLLVSSFIHEGE